MLNVVLCIFNTKKGDFRMSFKKDLTGQKINFLKILAYNYTTKKWVCQCECNNILEVPTAELLSNRKKSCGCQKYIRIKNKEGNYPRLKKMYDKLLFEKEASDWEGWEDFKNWSLGHMWMEQLSYKKKIKGKPYSKENLVFGIRYNSQFLPIESAKDWKIFYNSEDKEFLIRFRYNNTTVKQEHIKTIPELCQLHIKIYRRYFHKASFFE